jgi:hypothetical protein
MDLVTTRRRSSMSKKLAIAVLAVLVAAFAASAADAKRHRKAPKRHVVHQKAKLHGTRTPEPAPAPATEPAPEPAPAPSPEGHPGFRGHIVHYEQSPYFGGFLRIRNDITGEELTEYFGEKTDLECSHAAITGPYSPCDKSNLKDGTPVIHAEHAVNDFGHDVWTQVFLYVEAPPAEPPAPPADPAPPAYGSVFSFGEGLLTLVRANNGEHVGAVVAPSTDIECGPSVTGPWHKCSAEFLTPERPAAKADHAKVDGAERWLHVYLVVNP